MRSLDVTSEVTIYYAEGGVPRWSGPPGVDAEIVRQLCIEKAQIEITETASRAKELLAWVAASRLEVKG